MWEAVSLFPWKCAYLFTCMCIQVYMYVYVYIDMFRFMCVHTYAYTYAHLYACVQIRLSTSMYVHMHMYTCVCTYDPSTYIYVYLYATNKRWQRALSLTPNFVTMLSVNNASWRFLTLIAQLCTYVISATITCWNDQHGKVTKPPPERSQSQEYHEKP